MSASPEIGNSIDAGGIVTNYHDLGNGAPVLFLHGSGPGVSGWANWRLVLPEVSKSLRAISPDIVGFGFTERPENISYSLDGWVKHAIDFLDALEIEKTHLVGNSFGGALSLALAIRAPERVDKLILMGAAGVEFELTDGLDFAWGYTPSLENMRKLLDLFAYDRGLVTDELAQLRYEASMRPGIQEAYAAMFPAPRQNGVRELASDEAAIKAIDKPTLIIHGREDRIIPLSSSLKLFELIDDAEIHLFGRCGHWTQIEHNQRFNQLVIDFLTD
ncbi:MAG: alpha/beta hydrolase [Pseudomonadota bacterium]